MRTYGGRLEPMGVTVQLLLAGALALGWMVTPWAMKTAYACMCAGGYPAEYYVDRADIVAVGTIDSVPWPGLTLGNGHVTVDEYLKGWGPRDMVVSSSSSACGFPEPNSAGKPWVLFLNKQNGQYKTELCMGQRPLNERHGQVFLAEVRNVTGPGRPPAESMATGMFAGLGVGLLALSWFAAWVRGRKQGGPTS